MSHNFNWTNIPDSSKINEKVLNDLLGYSDKFFFGDANSTDDHYIHIDDNNNKFIKQYLSVYTSVHCP